MIWRRVLLLTPALLPLLPGAGHGGPRETLTALVGHSKAELMQRLGPPGDMVRTIDGERLFYETLDAGQVGGTGVSNTRAGGPGDVGPFPRTYSFRCRTEVVIRDGRVQAFNQTGNGCH